MWRQISNRFAECIRCDVLAGSGKYARAKLLALPEASVCEKFTTRKLREVSNTSQWNWENVGIKRIGGMNWNINSEQQRQRNILSVWIPLITLTHKFHSQCVFCRAKTQWRTSLKIQEMRKVNNVELVGTLLVNTTTILLWNECVATISSIDSIQPDIQLSQCAVKQRKATNETFHDVELLLILKPILQRYYMRLYILRLFIFAQSAIIASHDDRKRFFLRSVWFRIVSFRCSTCLLLSNSLEFLPYNIKGMCCVLRFSFGCPTSVYTVCVLCI